MVIHRNMASFLNILRKRETDGFVTEMLPKEKKTKRRS